MRDGLVFLADEAHFVDGLQGAARRGRPQAVETARRPQVLHDVGLPQQLEGSPALIHSLDGRDELLRREEVCTEELCHDGKDLLHRRAENGLLGLHQVLLHEEHKQARCKPNGGPGRP